MKYVDGYLFTGSLDKKIIVKVRPFYSTKPEDMHDYLQPTKRDFDPNIFILLLDTNNLYTKWFKKWQNSPEMTADKIVETSKSL